MFGRRCYIPEQRGETEENDDDDDVDDDGDDDDDDGDDDDDDGSKQRVGDHMIPPPTAVGGPTASNRHRILQEVNTKINTKKIKDKIGSHDGGRAFEGQLFTINIR